MAFDFAAMKLSARRTIHGMFAVDALYAAPGSVSPPVPLTARYHTKMATESAGDGDTIYLENVNRLVFNREELAALALTLQMNGRVTLIKYNQTFALADLVPIDGPIDVIWNVVADPRTVTP